MKEICSKCGGKFIENSTQSAIRSKKDKFAVCDDCLRKGNVKKANKKHLKEKEIPVIQQVKMLKRKYGILSVAYLMRKFKVTVPEAQRMMEL